MARRDAQLDVGDVHATFSKRATQRGKPLVERKVNRFFGEPRKHRPYIPSARPHVNSATICYVVRSELFDMFAQGQAPEPDHFAATQIADLAENRAATRSRSQCKSSRKATPVRGARKPMV